ncbi:glutamate dehydrogenase (NAD) [Haloactinospora alba]|uniref:Glutamate dehydrogenase (NAD) n=1 Tax=Haloactinospora alba TaxID=405555 RepID=A0A543NLR6_9ACTN|nr:NAD-glutamate dehydrogenase [Haloactinospora alba]TQN32747.1 glutamate dehydrogenase (NAD) [Haloactinospora alba]
MSGQPDAVRDHLLRDAVTQWSPFSGEPSEDQERVKRFLALYYHRVSLDELKERTPDQICGAALAHRELGEYRPQGRANVRVYTPTPENEGWGVGRSVVEIVTDDAPFLVDSVTMELRSQDVETHLVIHPQLRVARDLSGNLLDIENGDAGTGVPPLAESWMHIEIDRQTDPQLLERLESGINRVLADVRQVNEDKEKMRYRALELAREITAHYDALASAGVDAQEIAESDEFLRWAADGNFRFLGFREYSLVNEETADTPAEPRHGQEPAPLALQPRLGTGLGLLRMDAAPSQSFASLPAQAREKAREPHILVLTKANSRSTVHRSRYLDYIGVKDFDDAGNVVGERRFLGLFTHEAATTSITQIPILHRKESEVLELAGLDRDSYDGKDLVETLEDFPREELFQTPVPELYEIGMGVLGLRERRGTKLFLRRDPYGRYMSCMVYMPRDRYTTQVRLEIQNVLQEAFHGASMDHSVMVSSSPLAQLYLVVRARSGHALPDVDRAALESEITAATRSWDDDFREALEGRFSADRSTELASYRHVLPEGYKVDTPADSAAEDVARIDALEEGGVDVNLYYSDSDHPDRWRFKLYHRGEPISLSQVLPLLEHLGMEVRYERPYGLTIPEHDGDESAHAWIYDFGLAPSGGAADIPSEQLKVLFEDAFTALWHQRSESDGFNALVVRAGLTWRQLTLLRAYAKYLRQAGRTFSPAYFADVLVANMRIANLLVRLFESYFDPAYEAGRAERSEAIAEEIDGELEQVASLDHDRILRSFLAAVRATLRTNYFQSDPAREDGGPKPYLVYKLDPQRIPDLPAPRPRYEIYVYSPRTEGVHLRFGAVARGGLRWSDRPEDFRTEVLGLVKAQMVKNAVIVPSGAKGGFVCKRLPSGGRAEVQAEAVACYRQFVSGLLDVTDNLVDGEVTHPEEMVRYDGEDSYLVVAADKGTATFSDIANEVAVERGFWLGDAFASGGSVGYDHKEMGITARGAWESVKYHFRELGVDVQNEEFTVAGIGDMSGDVFGNGMLLSPHIRLVAAFDHRHVFLDPDPDAERGFAERQRLFSLPRSTWADYDERLISAGGGVYSRSEKAITITPQVRRALGIDEGVTSLTPLELIQYVLTAPVDLLWNGGIGTYVKASTETNADVGDKSNDPLRVDGADLRCKVVGEGGNLGVTQLGRIEFALAGGRVNADFIDNSAGVDTSDHEVNIKILLDREVAAGRLTKRERDDLFLGMTEDVAELTLDNNYAQNVALAASRHQAGGMLHVHARYMRKLERAGQLKRKLEFLPDDKAIASRRSSGHGLTGPEFATLLAYTKMTLKDAVAESDLPADPYLRDTLTEYFPAALRERFSGAMANHPLARQIITNQVVNEIVNRSGSTFVFRLNEELGADSADIARAYLVVQDVFGLPTFWQDVEELDHQLSVDTQVTMLLEARKLAERCSRWLLRNRTSPFDLSGEIAFFTEGVASIAPQLPELLQGRDLAAFTSRRDGFEARGVPTELATRVAAMVPAYSTFDLVEVAHRTDRPLRQVAEVYFDLAENLQISQLRERIIALPRDDRWNTMARSALRDDLYACHAELTANVLLSGDAGEAPDRLRSHWFERNRDAVDRAVQTLSEIWETERFDLATLSVALRSVRSLVASRDQ